MSRTPSGPGGWKPVGRPGDHRTVHADNTYTWISTVDTWNSTGYNGIQVWWRRILIDRRSDAPARVGRAKAADSALQASCSGQELHLVIGDQAVGGWHGHERDIWGQGPGR